MNSNCDVGAAGVAGAAGPGHVSTWNVTVRSRPSACWQDSSICLRKFVRSQSWIELVGHGHSQGVRNERESDVAAEPHLESIFTDLIRQCQKHGGYDLRIVLGHFLYSPCAQSYPWQIAPS